MSGEFLFMPSLARPMFSLSACQAAGLRLKNNELQ